MGLGSRQRSGFYRGQWGERLNLGTHCVGSDLVCSASPVLMVVARTSEGEDRAEVRLGMAWSVCHHVPALQLALTPGSLSIFCLSLRAC